MEQIWGSRAHLRLTSKLLSQPKATIVHVRKVNSSFEQKTKEPRFSFLQDETKIIICFCF